MSSGVTEIHVVTGARLRGCVRVDQDPVVEIFRDFIREGLPGYY